MRTKLRKKMHTYKRRNQRFDARLARIHRQYERVQTVKLVDENGKQQGFIVRFRGGVLGGRISSYELMYMDRETFNSVVHNRLGEVN